MKAVIDTNVVASGLFWKGPPADILVAWIDDKFQWVVSASILAEYHKTLRAMEVKYPPPASTWDFLRAVSLAAHLVMPVDLQGQVCSDAEDDKFLAAVIAGRASVIVSGDKALLRVDGYSGLNIVKPAAFLKMIKK